MPAARAASQDSTAAAPLAAIVGRWPSLTSKRAGEQRVDLVVLGDQDRQAAGGPGLRASFRRLGRGAAVERVVGGEARGERGGAYRFDQIAGEARGLERGELVAHRRRDQDEPPRDRRRHPRQRFTRRHAERVDRPERCSRTAPAAAPRRPARRGRCVCVHPSVAAAARSSEASIAAGATIRMSWPVRSGTASGGGVGVAGARQRNGDAEGRAFAGRLSTAIEPPMLSMIRFEMARPRPVPPNFRVEPPSACSNSRKIRA